MYSIRIMFCVISLLLGVGSVAQQKSQRIVSLNGAISEMVCALGLQQQIVGVDVTSTYPVALKEKPKVGHNRNISAEGVLTLNPTLVIGLQSQVTPQLKQQLQNAGVETVLLKQEFTVEGIRNMLKDVAAAVGERSRSEKVLDTFNQDMQALQVKPTGKKVLFIYARGAGTLLVSGKGTSIATVIGLAGAENAVTAFSDYKPLSAESLVAANPDVILLFTDGLKSMGGISGLLKVPGIAQTNAGQHKKIITMDGALLSGFTLRLPEAIRELHKKIAEE